MLAQDTVPRFGTRTFPSMNTEVSVTLSLPQPDVDALTDALVRPVFANTEAACSRFITGNPLDVANGAPSESHSVPEELYRAVAAARDSYELTRGAFDPRVITALRRLGYRHTFDASTATSGSARAATAWVPLGAWQPTLTASDRGFRLNLGGLPIDLGGVAKGHTVDVAAGMLTSHAESGCVNAGGDIRVWGRSPDDGAWRVGVEDPFAATPDDLIAVLELTDTGVATSSSRKRQWRAPDGEIVHHIIDPRTGRSARNGIRSVTVVHPQTRIAEALTKALFLAGEENIASAAEQFDAKALWVTADGGVHVADSLDPAVVWRRTR